MAKERKSPNDLALPARKGCFSLSLSLSGYGGEARFFLRAVAPLIIQNVIFFRGS